MTTRTDAEVAISAAAAGARVVREMFSRNDLTRISKSPTDFATEADLAAEQAIHAAVAAERPGDAFLGEETGFTDGTHRGRVWLVDPLCGTLNFAAQTPLFSVNVALAVDERTTVAASCDPIASETYWTDGSRACMRRKAHDEPLVPSSRSRLVDVNCDGRGEFIGPQLLTNPVFGSTFGARVTSTTLAVAWVAAGRRAGYITDGDLDRSVHFSAGVALCQAAGCTVTDLTGGSVHHGRGLIAAADPETHQALLDLVQTPNGSISRSDQRHTG